MKNSLYNILGVNSSERKEILQLSIKIGIPIRRLDYYNNNNILPSGKDLNIICKYSNLTKQMVMIMMGIYDHSLKKLIADNFKNIITKKEINKVSLNEIKQNLYPKFETTFGKLFNCNCLDLLKTINDETFDMIFADPPFNLKKNYLSNINDNLGAEEYINWTELWLDECIRTLKEGGSFFLWNLPKWNTYFSSYLNKRLNFRNWIVTDIKFSLPINGRLYPSHYSLLYYTKGEKPNTFHPDRLPMEVCPKCFTDLKDYGGYKDKMNPLGINLSDVWYDIPPVRHRKYKRREEANELSIKLLDRIIEMSTNEGDLIFDPFGGSGTTYVVSEIKKRNWIGVELGPIDTIIERFVIKNEEEEFLINYRKNYNKLFNDKTKANRMQLNLWTDDTFRKKEVSNKSLQNTI